MSYTALVLDEESHKKLVDAFDIPEGWEVIAHHMTINMGTPDKGPVQSNNEKVNVGETGAMEVETFAQDDLVMAVGVKSNIESSNERKHITLAVNRAEGGKPYLSNKLTEWFPVDLNKQIILNGTVKVQ
jgi:hypothetical protein